MKWISIFCLIFSLQNCSSTENEPSQENPTIPNNSYFPDANYWEAINPNTLGYSSQNINDLYQYLESKNTRSFMILVNGRIALEKYCGTHTSTSNWYWASAGKTLTASTIGIAESQQLLQLNAKVSQYLGTQWTSAPLEKENLITVKHLLCMTSGLNDNLGDNVSPQNLQYTADAGTRWAYHNVYVKLQDVIAQASGQNFETYFNNQLRNKIGMDGFWLQTGDNSVYYSTTRSMARFGLLALNNGVWNGQIVVPSAYMNAATNSSQNLNLSYGYLWWLNGKSSYRMPQTQLLFPGSLVPTAPNDMYCALGKNDQKIYLVPSKNMVVIRMGDAADTSNAALSDFDKVLWQKIMAL